MSDFVRRADGLEWLCAAAELGEGLEVVSGEVRVEGFWRRGVFSVN